MAKPGAIEAARKPKGRLVDLIDRYLATSRKEMGRTKAQVLAAIKRDELADRDAAGITSADILDFAERLGETRKPQTVQNYLSHLSAVFSVAPAAWGVEVNRDVMRDAMEAGKRLGLISKSERRDRRPTMEEIDALLSHFQDRSQRRCALPMHRVVAFAIFSTRRQEEITRILRADLEPMAGGQPARVLVRDMKHPGEKRGNDVSHQAG